MAELIRRDVEIFACLESEDYGGAADKVHCATIPFLNGYTVMTIYEPHGVPGIGLHNAAIRQEFEHTVTRILA